MPSHLTRHVFRCLIANEHILHAGCLRRHAVSRHLSRHRTRITYTNHNVQQRRTLFSFPQIFAGSARDEKSIGREPGVQVMEDYTRKRRMKARLPDTRDVDWAVHLFLEAKIQAEAWTLPDVQARLLVECLKYIRADTIVSNAEAVDQTSTASHFATSLDGIAKLLCRLKTTFVPQHLELARLIAESSQHEPLRARFLPTFSLVLMLCRARQPAEARDVLVQSQLLEADLDTLWAAKDPDRQSIWLIERRCLQEIVSAFMAEGDEAGMLSIVNLSSRMNLMRDQRTIAMFVEFYTQRQDAKNAEKWIDAFLVDQATSEQSLPDSNVTVRSITSRDTRRILECCLPEDFQELGRRVVRNLLDRKLTTGVWNEILAWDFTQHKSVDQLARQLDIMLETSETKKHNCKPNTSSINRFIEVAIAANDPYLAERLISLGKDRGIQPDKHTLILQMRYRLAVKDIDGALNAYKHVQNPEVSDEGYVLAVNQLIVALCGSSRHDFDTIMNVAGDLTDLRAAFEPETVQSLALLHLSRDELQDVQDLVKTYASRFSSEARKSLRIAIKDFCLDEATPPAILWDAYSILRNDFDEMPRSERTELMENCFRRNRPDMAIHIFSHMRTHSRDDTYPDASTYIAVFNGAARLRNEETLNAFHNQLKIDPQVEVTVGVRNALMRAFVATVQPRAAIRVWDDIAASQEGPDYSSIHTALRACEQLPFGDERAGEIWKKLRRDEIDLDQSLWAAYLAALAANGSVKPALKLLETATRDNEVYADELVIGRLYNACIAAGQVQAAGLVQNWAELECPEIWAALQTKWEVRGEEFGIPMKIFNLDEQAAS